MTTTDADAATRRLLGAAADLFGAISMSQPGLAAALTRHLEHGELRLTISLPDGEVQIYAQTPGGERVLIGAAHPGEALH